MADDPEEAGIMPEANGVYIGFAQAILMERYSRDLADWHDALVPCPHCGGDYVHLASVAVNAGGDITVVLGPNQVVRGRGKPTGRGASVWLSFWCEGCDVVWEQHLQFHKGGMFQNLERLTDAEDPRVVRWGPATLWRD